MPEPITIAALGIGSWFGQWAAGKVFDLAWQRFKDSQLVERAIDRTNQTFTAADHRWSSGSIHSYLEEWTRSSGFKRSLRKFSEEGQVDEDQLVDQFLGVTNYPEEAERSSAREIVREFLQHLDDELNETDEGARLAKQIKREHAKREQEHEEILEGVSQLQESAEEQRSDIEALRRDFRDLEDGLSQPAREAVNAYLKELENRESPQKLVEQDQIREAVEIYEGRLQKIRKLQDKYPRVEPLFRDRKQYLLLKSASLYSQLGSEAEASRNYELARADGFTSPKHRQLALTVLVNLQRSEEYREVMEGGKVADEKAAEINLLLLEERWTELIQALPDEPQEFRHAHLRVVAELSLDEPALNPAELSYQLDQAERLAEDRRIQKAQLAMMTVDLLARVVDERLGAPELDRSELVDSARSRTERALSEYENAEADVGLYSLLQKARQLYYLLGDEQKQEKIEDWYNEVTDGLNSRDEWDRALSKGRITHAHHLFLQAGDLLDNPAGSQKEQAISLLESAFHLAEEQELRLAIAERLIDLHLKSEQPGRAGSILDRLDEVLEHRLILLKLPVVQERRGTQGAINYLSDKADEYPKHLYLRRALIRHMISRIKEVVSDPIGREEVNSLVIRIKKRGRELQRILPTDQHTVMVARGLFAARHYNGILNLLDEVVEGDEPPVKAMQIRAQALLKLERLDTAAEQFAKLADRLEDWKYAVEASAYWIQDNEPEKSISLLESWVESHPDNPHLQVNLAAALIEAQSEEPKAGRRAFNLLAAACRHDQVDQSRLWMAMHRAASIAGKEAVARRYFRKGLPAPSVNVRSTEDMQEVWSTGKEGIVGFRLQGKEGMEALVEWNREYTDRLNKLYGAELVSYGDLFRKSSRMMQTWTHWTDAARKHHRTFPQQTAIKAPWPAVTRRSKEKRGLLLDVTALLSIWKLDEAETLLNAAYSEGIEPHIRADDLALLRRASSDYAASMFGGGTPPYEELVETLKDCGLLPHYEQDEVKQLRQAVPEHLHEHLMASTPDVGLVYELQGAVYVSDQQESIVSDYEVISKEVDIMTSADLLGALVGHGFVGDDEAREAQEQDERFQGWKEKMDLDLPEHVVMSGFAIADWYKTGLLNTFEGAWLQGEPGWPELHLGPYAVNHVREQDQEQRTKEKKTESVSTLYTELKELIDQRVVTVLPVEDSSPRDEDGLRLPEMAPYPSNLIQIADDHGLDVWSDDRMIGYLLWPFGHPLPVPEVKQEFIQFRERHSDVNLTTTEELAEKLSREEVLEKKDAEELGYELFKLGYRPLNFRLALAYLFRNFAYKSGSPRYEPLFRAVKSTIVDTEGEDAGGEDIPNIDPEPLQRLMFASMLPELIASVWQVPVPRSIEERRILATDLIDLAVGRLKELNQELGDGITSFWVGLLRQIAAPRVGRQSDDESPEEIDEHLNDAVEWFSEVLLERDYVVQRRKVIPGIEDHLIDVVSSNLPPEIGVIPDEAVIEENEERPTDQEICGRKIAAAISTLQPFIVALFESDLIDDVDPLFRRALGVLARIEGGYKCHSIYPVQGVAIEVDEEEKERLALQIVSDAIEGDPQANHVIKGDWSVEAVWNRPVPEEVKNEDPELPETHDVPLKISLPRLLLRDEVRMLPGLVDTTIRQLQLLDPSLAQDIQAVRNDLLSEDEQVRQHARETLALDLLRSPFYEFQRDLEHAISRLRGIDTNRLEKFLSPEHGWHAGEKNPLVEVWGDREYPRSMLTDFRMLYAEPTVIYESAEKEVDALLEQLESDDDESIDLRKVVEGMVRKTKDHISPLEMARSLLTLFVFAETKGKSISIHIDDCEWTLQEWIGKFIESILDPGEDQVSEGGAPVRSQHYKEIHAIALRLGANVAGNDKHIQKWSEELDEEKDVLVQWVWSTMLFASRVVPFLVGRFEAIPKLKNVLDKVIRDLNIPYDEPVATPDRFNPFLLGPHLLDHEVAAVLYVVGIFARHDDAPAEVLDFEKVRSVAGGWEQKEAGKAQQVYDSQKEEASDVIDLKMPLSPHDAAISLIQAIDERDD
jgi:hypothetical protein